MNQDSGGCDHSEGSVMGKCAICGNIVCSECYRSVYNQMICGEHESLEEESAWEVIGFYSDSDKVAQARSALDERDVTSLIVEADADTIELYVPPEEKDDGWEALCSVDGDYLACRECRVHFSSDVGICPMCGSKPK